MPRAALPPDGISQETVAGAGLDINTAVAVVGDAIALDNISAGWRFV